MLKHFCDICGRELDQEPNVKTNSDTKSVCITRLCDLSNAEVCPECTDKIINFIDNIRIKCENTCKKSKREIGDKVRCLINNPNIGLYAGRIYSVCEIPKDCDDAVYVDVGDGWQALLKFGQYSYRLG